MWPCREDPWASCFPRWGLEVLREGSYLSMNHQQQNSNKPQAQVLKIQQDEKSSLSSHRGNGFQSLLGLQSPLDLLGFGVNKAGVMSCRAPRLCLSPNAVSHPYIFLSYFVRKVGWKCNLEVKWYQTRPVLRLEIEAATCAPFSGYCSCAQDLSAQHPQQKMKEFCAFRAHQLCWGHHLPCMFTQQFSHHLLRFPSIFYPVPTKHRIDFFCLLQE